MHAPAYGKSSPTPLALNVSYSLESEEEEDDEDAAYKWMRRENQLAQQRGGGGHPLTNQDSLSPSPAEPVRTKAVEM